MIPTEVLTVKPNTAQLEKNQLLINEETTLKEWKELGCQLSQMQGNMQFWIGDWIRFGEMKGYCISDVYDDIEDITSLDRDTLKHLKSVAGKVPTSARCNLSFSHHVEVAKLPESEQTYFLNMALHDKLSVRELRLQILTAFTPGNGIHNTKYNNNNPFPLRLGDLHACLQEEAFDLESTIHERAISILREYFIKAGKLVA